VDDGTGEVAEIGKLALPVDWMLVGYSGGDNARIASGEWLALGFDPGAGGWRARNDIYVSPAPHPQFVEMSDLLRWCPDGGSPDKVNLRGERPGNTHR
jgi:hypothetical protein